MPTTINPAHPHNLDHAYNLQQQAKKLVAELQQDRLLPEMPVQLTYLDRRDLRPHPECIAQEEILRAWQVHESQHYDNSRHAAEAVRLIRKVFRQGQHGVVLDLSHFHLHSLPESLGDLSALRRLSLNHNCLKVLPASIIKLKHLQRLCLRDNQISQWPAAINSLTALQYLDLSKNRLIQIPTSINQLQSLEILALDHNRIGQLPKEISQLTQLRIIWLAFNCLWGVPLGITTLPQLQALALDFNDLYRLPQLPACSTLGNPVTNRHQSSSQFADYARQCQNNSQMRTDERWLRLLAGTMGSKHLQELDETEVRMLELLTAFLEKQWPLLATENEEKRHQKLRFRTMFARVGRAIIAALQHPERQQDLDLSGLGLRDQDLYPQMFMLPNLRRLDLSNNCLKTYFDREDWQWTHLPSLEYLNLNDNNLQHVSPKFVHLAPKLQWAGFFPATANPLLIELATWVEQETARQRLANPSQSFPQIKQAADEIACSYLNSQLSPHQSPLKLVLAGYQLQSLPSLLGEINALRELDLSGNNFNQWPPILNRLTQLQQLDLRGNRHPDLSLFLQLLVMIPALQLLQDPAATDVGNLSQLLQTQLERETQGLASVAMVTRWIEIYRNRNTITQHVDNSDLHVELTEAQTRLQRLTISSPGTLREISPQLLQLPRLKVIRITANDVLTDLSAILTRIIHFNSPEQVELRSADPLTRYKLVQPQLRPWYHHFSATTDLACAQKAVNVLSKAQLLLGPGQDLAARLEDVAAIRKLTAIASTNGNDTDLHPSIQVTGAEFDRRFTGDDFSQLHLDHLQLTSLPDKLRIDQVTTLNLANNNLRTLPNWLGDLTNLRHLNLANNCFSQWPQVLNRLENLETLDFRGNRGGVINVPPAIFDLLPTVLILQDYDDHRLHYCLYLSLSKTLTDNDDQFTIKKLIGLYDKLLKSTIDPQRYPLQSDDCCCQIELSATRPILPRQIGALRHLTSLAINQRDS